MYIFGLQIGSLKGRDKTEKPSSNSSRFSMYLDYIPADFLIFSREMFLAMAYHNVNTQ